MNRFRHGAYEKYLKGLSGRELIKELASLVNDTEMRQKLKEVKVGMVMNELVDRFSLNLTISEN